jgi:hypothetical protein
MARCQNGESLLSLSRRQPRLVVCLRHLGYTLCRESLADLARLRPEIESSGTGILIVTLPTNPTTLQSLRDLDKCSEPAPTALRTRLHGTGTK